MTNRKRFAWALAIGVVAVLLLWAYDKQFKFVAVLSLAGVVLSKIAESNVAMAHPNAAELRGYSH